MLPSEPPNITYKDFDPAEEPQVEEAEEDEEDGNEVEISSVEINILIYLYLLESNFSHTAFTLLSESNLPQTSLFQYFNPGYSSSNGSAFKSKTNGTPGVGKSPRDGLFGNPAGKIPRGELVRKLWKAVRWEEVERHITSDGQPFKPPCPNPFHLIVPHMCPPGYPSASGNPKTAPPSWKRQSPTKRPEAFPPPPHRIRSDAAGPSRRRENVDENDVKGKRKSRDDTASRRRGDGSRSRKSGEELPEKSTKSKRSVSTRDQEEEDVQSGDEAFGRRSKKSRSDGARLEVQAPPRRQSGSPVNGVKSARSRQSSAESEEQAGQENEEEAEEEEEVEEVEEVEEEDEEDDEEDKELLRLAEEKEKLDEERRSRPGWIDSQHVTCLKEHRDMVKAIAFNPKNRDVLASGSGDGTARLWDLSPPKPAEGKKPRKPIVIYMKTIESNMKTVTCMSWHPEGTVLAIGSADGTGRLFTPSGHLQGIMSYGRGAIRAIKFSPDGSRILIAKADFTVGVWLIGSSPAQRMLRSFQNHTGEVNDVAWLDDSVIASAGNDKKILVYRATDTRPTYNLIGHQDDITRIKWQPKSRPGQPDSERLLASSSDDGTVRIWSLPDYPKGPGSVTGSVGSRSASPMKQRTMDEDDEMLDLGSIKAVRVIEVIRETVNWRMDSVEWSPGGDIIAAGGQDTTLKLFNALTGELLHVLKGLEDGVGSFAFSPIEQGLVAAGGWNGHVMLWDVKTGEVRGEYEFDEEPTKSRTRQTPMNLTMQYRDDGQQLAIGLANKEVMLINTGRLNKSARG